MQSDLHSSGSFIPLSFGLEAWWGLLALLTLACPPAPCCQTTLFCLATPSLARGVPPANDRSPLSSTAPLPELAAILSLGGGQPQACGVGVSLGLVPNLSQNPAEMCSGALLLNW